MSYEIAMIIDLLDELDLDILGFEDALESSLLFSVEASYPEASTSTLHVASTDDELPPFELLDEIPLGPRKWIAAGPPVWDQVLVPAEDRQPLGRTSKNLTIQVPPRSPSRATSRPLPKENLPSPITPTERAFARLRARGSSLALRALNSPLGSPEILHRVLI
ncbi:hypothetical protein MVEN_01027600 [Mycena venus]|uniref:Uncharacterized protein n=1 Tax=Mycena venus TaxID=2733690 RepID=A0A8H6YE93_9AGAR|nr:hypothetical protein MVEN_01027600 [Mycena venus]